MRNSSTSQLEFSTGSINSGEEPLGQQTCTRWPIMTTLVYRDGRDLGRGGFPFIHHKQTCTDGIGEALLLIHVADSPKNRHFDPIFGAFCPHPANKSALRAEGPTTFWHPGNVAGPQRPHARRLSSGVRSCADSSPLATAIHRQPNWQRPNGARSRRAAPLYSVCHQTGRSFRTNQIFVPRSPLHNR